MLVRAPVCEGEFVSEGSWLIYAVVVNLCGGNLHYAPLENPQSIIDLGTGTGIWTMDSMYTLVWLGMAIDLYSGRRISQRFDTGHRSEPHSTVVGAAECQVHGR